MQWFYTLSLNQITKSALTWRYDNDRELLHVQVVLTQDPTNWLDFKISWRHLDA